MMNKRGIAVILYSILLLLMSWTVVVRIQAQGGDGSWSSPDRLSTEEGIYQQHTNVMLADNYGYVHVFWVENVHPPDGRGIIQYSRFDGETWSTPFDIYASSTSINRLSVTIDRNDVIHLSWTQGSNYRNYSVYHSSVPAYDTLTAKHWSKPSPIEDVEAFLFQMQVDSKGVFHLVYTRYGSDPGVYYTYSEDQGVSWVDARWLDPDILLGYAPDSLHFVLDQEDGLHVLWHYNATDERDPDWIRYIHSLDGGKNWALPVMIDQNEVNNIRLRAPGPRLMVQDQTVHVIWAGGEQNYRNHRFSTDRGQTWSASTRILGNLNGQAQDSLGVDGAGRVHFLGQLRFPQGIYHAYWDQDHWSVPELIYFIRSDSNDTYHGYHAHNVLSAFRNGNQLVTTFFDNPPHNDRPPVLYTMNRMLDDIAPLPIIPTPTLAPTMTPLPRPTSIPSTPTPTLTPRPLLTEVEASVPNPDTFSITPATVLGLAMIPTILVVGGIVAFQLMQKKH